jgi:hypothetical protein
MLSLIYMNRRYYEGELLRVKPIQNDRTPGYFTLRSTETQSVSFFQSGPMDAMFMANDARMPSKHKERSSGRLPVVVR